MRSNLIIQTLWESCRTSACSTTVVARSSKRRSEILSISVWIIVWCMELIHTPYPYPYEGGLWNKYGLRRIIIIPVAPSHKKDLGGVWRGLQYLPPGSSGSRVFMAIFDIMASTASSFTTDASCERETSVVPSITTSDSASTARKTHKRKCTANTWEHTREPQGVEPERCSRRKERIYYCKYCVSPSCSTVVSTTFRNHLLKEHGPIDCNAMHIWTEKLKTRSLSTKALAFIVAVGGAAIVGASVLTSIWKCHEGYCPFGPFSTLNVNYYSLG